MVLREVNEKIILLKKRRFLYLPDINKVLDAVNEEFGWIGREAVFKYCVSFWIAMMILGETQWKGISILSDSIFRWSPTVLKLRWVHMTDFERKRRYPA